MTALIFWLCVAICVLPFAATGFNALTRKRRHAAEQRALAASIDLQRRLEARRAAERSLAERYPAAAAHRSAR